MENDMISKMVYVGKCTSNRLVGRPFKRWTDSVKDWLKKRGLDVRQARRTVHDRSEWRGVRQKECLGRSPGNEPLTSMSCHSCGLQRLYETLKDGSLSVVKPSLTT